MKTYAFISRGFNLKRLSRFLVTLGVGLLIFLNVETAQAQDIEITLTWTGNGNFVDLWVIDPDGNIYTWDNYAGISGISPDIYTADAGTAINGNYLVEVCYWSAPDEPPDPIEATVVIILRKGTINEQSTTYGPHTITDTDILADSDYYVHTYPDAWWTVTTFTWPPGTGGGGGAGGGSRACFIATAAYTEHRAQSREQRDDFTLSSPLSAQSYKSLITLQKFRDERLLTNPLGRAFVSCYERISPPVARYIEDKESLKAVVRFYLKPIVWGARKTLK